jgi:hypothetical protein
LLGLNLIFMLILRMMRPSRFATIEVGNQLKEPNATINRMSSDISEIKGNLEILSPLIRDGLIKRIAQVSRNPGDLHSIQEAKKILASAKAANTKLDQTIIKNAGKKFIEAAKETPDAWNAALALLDYRSLLNSDLGPPLINPRPAESICYVTSKTHILTTEPVDENAVWKSQRISAVGGGLSDDAAAHMEEIGKSVKRCGVQFLIFEMPNTSNELLLDGLSLKNVVIRDTRVAYHGGRILLENVYFVNCTFDFPSAPASSSLASAILDAPAITFNKAT